MFHASRPSKAATPLVSLFSPPYSDVVPVLSLKKLEKCFAGQAAVKDVSLDVPRGAIFGVIGRSGAGKSTLLRMASLLEHPDSGEVLYAGVPVTGLKGPELRAARRRVGVVFQAFNLFSARTAAGNVAFPLEAAGVSRGERQRVAIARALALEPEILFCDEATSALDPETTRSILDLIAELKARLGLTVVMVTHQMEVVRRICEEVAVLEAGALVETTSAADLFSRPRTDAARRLVFEEVGHA
jgi:D-methionine transport system ATP-binding protein